MILGIEAAAVVTSVQGAGGGTGEAYDTGQRALLDFINEQYSWDESPLIIGDIIDHPELIGMSGLAIGTHGGANPEVQFLLDTGNPVQAFLADYNFTIIIDAEVDNLESYQYLLRVTNDVRGNFAYLRYSGAFESYDSNQSAQRQFFDWENGTDGGVLRVGMTRTNSLLSMSVAGNAVINDVTALVLPEPGYDADFIGFGNSFDGHAFNLRKMKIFEPQTDTVLRSLSTP